MAIKISELSVGDWIHHDFYEVDMRVVAIYGNNERVIAESRSGHEFTCYLDHFTPIPITADILEKNGFMDKGSCLFRYEREWRGDKSAVNICSFDEELWFADFEFRDGRTCMSNIPLIYINQLQHVLRLVGVDKEINL